MFRRAGTLKADIKVPRGYNPLRPGPVTVTIPVLPAGDPIRGRLTAVSVLPF